MAAGRSEKIVDFEPGLRVHSCPAILHIVFDVIPIYAGERDHVQRFEELVIVGAHPPRPSSQACPAQRPSVVVDSALNLNALRARPI